MKITLEQSGTTYTLHSYRDGVITVRPPNGAANDEEKLLLLTGSCLLSARQLVTEWPPQQLTELMAEHLQAIPPLKPELLLLGSGDKLRFLAPAQQAALVRLSIGYEVMDTAAACRTYNLLVAEGRNVVAALFAH
ncbi:MAG: MTH938/NDUFAF3 family protein [Gammaproteobacteria bacterium]|nr:MTH938/NDUFAF3 family protein [Gammaproteobacteria bacterium]